MQTAFEAIDNLLHNRPTDHVPMTDGPWGDTLTGKQLAEVLLVTCKDGYKVAYSVGEADPGTSKGQVLIVDKADGAPLDAKSGPFQIVVENDLRPARSARMVEKVQLIDLK